MNNKVVFTRTGKHVKRAVIAGIFFFFSGFIQAQYFGQNKVKYGTFDFKIAGSKTFDLYHYLHNDSLVIGLLKDAEKWRYRHLQLFKDTFNYKIPVFVYNNHGDFQQTSVVGGLIGTSTGGVTEILKNRVTFPLTPTYVQTDHVMGHELVHAHQYNMIKSSDSLSYPNMANIPLWMTEGMAEYLSIGSVDAHTAMWIRDAVANDFFPAIKDLNKPRYFPYRFGHAFWAFVGGTFGDAKIVPLYRETAKHGVKEAFKRELGMPIDSFSKRWKTATENFYKPMMKGRDLKAKGVKLVDSKNGGRLNITPSVSPDGKYFIFLSERNIFSLDLFLADTKTGKIIRKISKRTRKSHLDALSAFESAGTWSPDSQKYAFTIFSKGKNKIVIADVKTGKISDEFFVKDIPAISNLDWSPDGKKILFTGLVEGQSDLYSVDVNTKNLIRYTHDYYANIQAQWSPDGMYIVYVTDKGFDNAPRPKKHLSFAILNVMDKHIEYLQHFPQSNNLNPVFGPGGNFVYFLSDREGFRDLYRFELPTGKVEQLTRFFTGISGITKYAPAISISNTGDILYSFYYDSKYHIYKLPIAGLKPETVQTGSEDFTAARLPSLHLADAFVTENLQDESTGITGRLTQKKYEPHFKLDYISNGGVGIATGRYGTGMAGGVNMLFGDMLNENQLYIGAVLNGELQDFGGQAAYLNRKSRFSWGAGLSHVPYRYVTRDLSYDSISVNGQIINTIKETYNLYRVFKEQATLFSYYPFSRATRIEGNISFSHYSYRLDKYNNYYDMSGYYYYGQDRERNVKEGLPDAFSMQDASIAYVGDDSSFGLTAPMHGYRYRLELQQTFGRITMSSVLLDARKYFYLKPVTFAFKAFHYARLGKDANNDLMPPLYLGYETLIRGYNYAALEQSNVGEDVYNNLIGSRMLLGNFEIRVPFTGPERLALIKSGLLFTDINFFVDTGITWGGYRQYDMQTNTYNENERNFEDSMLISSVGISTRINLFGQIILEPYYAFPLQLNLGSKGVFGLNFTPGW